ncbi:hypothetical protein [Agromyces kandeliae]|uniref:Di-and tripeptidase n=1 Tax=Agromyces kandeliae TaxID=2666141 RepID=A0A6L5R649_9MICO|nr:hypothetical protein [Agromyces kandeliae]MRX45370.1 hypothetical protein [Agromyces kandeliae]
MSERVHRITTLGRGAPEEAAPEAPDVTGEPGSGQAGTPRTDPADRAVGLERGFDRLLSIQRPIVLAHLRAIRRNHPTASPEELVRVLERRYLTAVTTGGAAVGATAVVPGISTGITLALSGVETAGFLEATALFAQSVAEVHGLHVENPDRARALVMTLMMGREGADLVRQFAAQATGKGVPRNAYFGEIITSTLPRAVMGSVVDRLRHVFVKQFAVRGGAGIIGRAIPFGIGAAIGGIGNHVLGRRVLQQSRLAFGPAPFVLPVELEPRGDETAITSAGRRLARAVTTAGRVASRPFGRLSAATSKGDRADASADDLTPGGDDGTNEPLGDGEADDPVEPRADRPADPDGTV